MSMTISNQQVMKSNAGYYIGTGYNDTDMGMTEDDGFPLPYSRDSEYFATREDAQKMLDYWSKPQWRTILVWTDGSWMEADDHCDKTDRWRGDDYMTIQVTEDMSGEETDEFASNAARNPQAYVLGE